MHTKQKLQETLAHTNTAAVIHFIATQLSDPLTLVYIHLVQNLIALSYISPVSSQGKIAC